MSKALEVVAGGSQWMPWIYAVETVTRQGGREKAADLASLCFADGELEKGTGEKGMKREGWEMDLGSLCTKENMFAREHVCMYEVVSKWLFYLCSAMLINQAVAREVCQAFGSSCGWDPNGCLIQFATAWLV